MFRDNDIDDINIHIEKIKNDAAMKYKSNYEPTLDENTKVYKVIQNYIKKNSRIIYGGFAQHLLIKKKNKDDGIYKEIDGVCFNFPDIADMEFYSPEPLTDIVNLTNELFKLGFKYIEAKEEVILINGFEEDINRLDAIDGDNTITSIEMKCYNNCILPQHLNNLEELQIPNCLVYNIPIYPNLKILNCENTKVGRIESYPLLETVDATNCEELKSIQVSPELKSLTCENSKIRRIQSYPKLEHLNASYCEDLEIIEISPELTILNCQNSNIKNIGSFPELVELYCFNCPELESIGICPKLKILHCTNCPNLTELSIFPLLEELQCPSNIEVPVMPNLQQLEQQ